MALKQGRQVGFTLIELMVAVVIVGILSAVAIPAYQRYVARAARAQAMSTLLNTAQLEERYFTNNGTYLAVAAPPASGLFQNYSGGDAGSRKYDVTVTAAAGGTIASSYVVTATPSNGFSDVACGTLTIDNLGTKTSSAGSVADCWR